MRLSCTILTDVTTCFFLLWEVVLFANKNYIMNHNSLPRVSFTSSYRLKSKLDKYSLETKTVVGYGPIISWSCVRRSNHYATVI